MSIAEQDSAKKEETNSSDLEKSASSKPTPALDIEHTQVEDDPRMWSKTYKWILVAILSMGALTATMAASIFFPAIGEVQRDFNTTTTLISLSISLYILFQGICPIFWSPIAELYGRKICLVTAMVIFVVGMVVTSRAPNMTVLIVFRIIAAIGASATQSIASGCLADAFDPIERGQVIGIYYGLPAMGPALSPVVGGALTEVGTWRAAFYFSASAGFVSLISYCLMRETFRTERSAAWQAARVRAIARMEAAATSKENVEEVDQENLTSPLKSTLGSNPTSTSTSTPIPDPDSKWRPFISPSYHSPGLDTIQSYEHHEGAWNDLHRSKTAGDVLKRFEPSLDASLNLKQAKSLPTERERENVALESSNGLTPRLSRSKSIRRTMTSGGERIKISPTLLDLSPLGSAWTVAKLPHNLIALIFSGFIFASQYSLAYTAARTFAKEPYNLSPVLVGTVLFAFGGGGVLGSFLGGRLSDKRLEKIKEKNGEEPLIPEERLKTIFWAMALQPCFFIMYGWTAYFKVHLAAPIVALFFLGLSQVSCYSVTLSYLIDRNNGRSLGTAALNSLFRGVFAFISSQTAATLQDRVGDGALFSGWAILLMISSLSIVLVAFRGKDWRDPDWKWPNLKGIGMMIRGKNRENGVNWIRERRELALKEASRT